MEMGGPPYATEVQLSEAVTATLPNILERYRQNRRWKLYAKEWIYRNLLAAGTAWLDFGCGTGEITTQLALLGATRVVALDVTPGLLTSLSGALSWMGSRTGFTPSAET